MNDLYKLEDGKIIPCESVEEWAMWFENADRKVARTNVGELRVSTVFLGADHSFGDGPPLLFETMVFGGPEDEDDHQERYATIEEARAGHDALVKRLQAERERMS